MAILTLTSDIGQQDFLVGAIKGQLWQINPAFQLTDITHQLPPFNFPQAAYVCRNTLQHFPPNTYHIILVNLFDTPPAHLLLAQHKGQYILCADNGLLTMILEGLPEKVVSIPLEADTPATALYIAGVMGNVIDLLDNGRPLSDFGDTSFALVEKNPLKPLLYDDSIEGQIIFIDHFENVVVNISREVFEASRRDRPFKIVFKRDEVIDSISNTYADVPEGEKLALFNSAGLLEIAINKGNAAGLFGLLGYSEKSAQNAFLQNRLFYQTVKVFFE
jgi:S-adenosyl-L-methionine hydrolase (adenosine-forming)